MTDKIKKFFAKKKIDAKFKLAGPGHKLTESSSNAGTSKKQAYIAPPINRMPTDATKQAAEAALARLSTQRKDTNFNTSLAAIQAQVRRELEAEKKKEGEKAPTPPRQTHATELEASPLLSVKGVYFRCPMISEEILSKEEWKVKIKEFLLEQLAEEQGITACLMIHSCNYNRTKVTDCVDILCKYLENIIAQPEETKFHKIRCSNNTFRDKVLPIFGAIDLLLGAGFTKKTLEHNGNMEDFYVFEECNVNGLETLEFLRDALKSEDRIEMELDRNLQVLSPAQASKQIHLPQDFYTISPEDLKREQQMKTETVENLMVLRTKAMREKDEIRELRKYKFALIRIRFPDGLYLQGTFSVYEKLKEVYDFVQENLEFQDSFSLSISTGHKFEESDLESTLFDLRLVPATILNFQWNSEQAVADGFLKPEIMVLVQSM